MNRILAALTLSAAMLGLSGAACTPPNATPAGTTSQTTAASVSQSLALAEATATGALKIATDLSKSGTVSVQTLKDVVAAFKVVDAAVHVGNAAVQAGDLTGALAQLSSPAVAEQLAMLASFIANHGVPKP